MKLADVPAWLLLKLEEPKQKTEVTATSVPARKYAVGQRGTRLREVFGKLNSEGYPLEVIKQTLLWNNENEFDPPKTEEDLFAEIDIEWGLYASQNGQGPASRGGQIISTGSWKTADHGRAEPVEWWWENHIPAGKLGLLDGDPNLGKSVILCDLIASATTGRILPDGSKPTRTGGAILFAPEDGYQDTVIPRLHAAGADLSKVLVAHAADYGHAIQLPKDLEVLASMIKQLQAVFIAFDPWEFFLEADIIKGREQRIALEPVSRCIAELRVVLIGTRHLNQQSGQKALYRGRGDITGIGVSRYGFIVGKDPKSEDPDDHVMVPHKHNLAPRKRVKAVRYRLEETTLEGTRITAPRISWNGVTEVTPDQAIGSDSAKPQTARQVMEEQILPKIQAEGPMLAADGWAVMESFGIKSSDTISRARDKVGIRAAKQRGSLGGDWYWYLPGQEVPDLTETPKYERTERSNSSNNSIFRSGTGSTLREDVDGEERCRCGSMARATNGRCIRGHDWEPA